MTEFTQFSCNENGEIKVEPLDPKDILVDPDYKKDGFAWEIKLANYPTHCLPFLNQQQWEDEIKKMMHKDGWTCDRDDETTLGFSYIEGEFHWIRDYCKKMRRYVQYNGNQKVNLKVTKNDCEH